MVYTRYNELESFGLDIGEQVQVYALKTTSVLNSSCVPSGEERGQREGKRLTLVYTKRAGILELCCGAMELKIQRTGWSASPGQVPDNVARFMGRGRMRKLHSGW